MRAVRPLERTGGAVIKLHFFCATSTSGDVRMCDRQLGFKLKLHACVLAALGCLAPTGIARAAEQPLFLNAPSKTAAPIPRMAVQFGLKLQIPDGRGLARLLIDSGVNQEDAARAARLAAGHMGEHDGGCSANVTVSRGVDGSGFRVIRVALMTRGTETVIERRGAELTISSQRSAPRPPQIA